MKKQNALNFKLELGLRAWSAWRSCHSPLRAAGGRCAREGSGRILWVLWCFHSACEFLYSNDKGFLPNQPHWIPRKRLCQNTLLTLTKQLGWNGGAFEINRLVGPHWKSPPQTLNLHGTLQTHGRFMDPDATLGLLNTAQQPFRGLLLLGLAKNIFKEKHFNATLL